LILWENVRDLGIVLWTNSDAVLRSVVLTLAQNEFINSDKNPESCALFYAMLGKKSILANLYRKNPVHSRIYDLLSKNFGEDRWKSAAIKNAFVLKSKNRLVLSCSFFILAGRIDEAIGICMKNVKDVQLGLLIARLCGNPEAFVRSHILNLIDGFVSAEAPKDILHRLTILKTCCIITILQDFPMALKVYLGVGLIHCNRKKSQIKLAHPLQSSIARSMVANGNLTIFHEVQFVPCLVFSCLALSYLYLPASIIICVSST
jgi:hypothetical protein